MTASSILRNLPVLQEQEVVSEIERLRGLHSERQREAERVRQEMDDLANEVRALEQYRNLLRSMHGREPLFTQVGTTVTVSAPAHITANGHAQHGSKAKKPPTGDLIRALMEQHPDSGRFRGTWTPGDIHMALASQGIEITKNLIRVTLRRMVERGEMVRYDDGNSLVTYGLATPSTDGEAPSMEAE